MSPLKLAAITASIAAVATMIFVLDVDPRTPAPDHRADAKPRPPARAPAHASARAGGARRAEANAVELADLRHEVRQLAFDAEQAPTQPPAPHGDPEPDASPMSDEDAVQLAAEVFEEHLSTQTPDPEATREAQSHIAAVFEQPEAGGRLLAMDCGEALCRGEFAFDDVGQRDARLHDVGSLMPWDTDGFFRSDPEDDTRVSIYFSRAGQPLPRIDGES